MNRAQLKDDQQTAQYADATVAAFTEIAPPAAVSEYERDAFGDSLDAFVGELRPEN